MSTSYLLAAVAVMALVTYLPRVLPLTLMKRKIENQFVCSFLYYIPYAVLTAMTFPGILYSTSSIYSAIAGLGTAILLAYKKKSLLTVAVGAVMIVFLSERLLALML